MSLILLVDDEITLRFILPSHAEEIATVIDKNRDYLAKWLTWATNDYKTDEVRSWIDQVNEAFGRRTELALSIIQNGRLVGGIGWTNWQSVNNSAWGMRSHTADIGYWLAADAQGQGIVTRSTAALIEYGFAEVGLHRITIRAEPANQPSWSVPERLGFEYEGTQRHVCFWKDRWVDHRCYAMIAEDWQSPQPPQPPRT